MTEAEGWQAERDRRQTERGRHSHLIDLEKRIRSHAKHIQDLRWMGIIFITAIIITVLIHVVPPLVGKLTAVFLYISGYSISP